MTVSSELYRGFEIRLLTSGSPPFKARIRRIGSRLFERVEISAATSEELRAAARAEVERCAAAGQARTAIWSTETGRARPPSGR